MTPAALGEMVHFGFDPERLDVLSWADISSWRQVMASYFEAADRAAKG